RHASNKRRSTGDRATGHERPASLPLSRPSGWGSMAKCPEWGLASWERPIMPCEIPAPWMRGRILAVLVGFGILSLILFGITQSLVTGSDFVRVAGAYLRGRQTGALQERAAVARQAVNLARLAIVCGPSLGIFTFLIALPFVLLE